MTKSQENYFKACNEVLDYVQANMVDSPLNQLQLTIDTFKLRVRLHEYFEQSFQMESCKQLLYDAIKEEKLMVKICSKQYNTIMTNQYNRDKNLPIIIKWTLIFQDILVLHRQFIKPSKEYR